NLQCFVHEPAAGKRQDHAEQEQSTKEGKCEIPHLPSPRQGFRAACRAGNSTFRRNSAQGNGRRPLVSARGSVIVRVTRLAWTCRCSLPKRNPQPRRAGHPGNGSCAACCFWRPCSTTWIALLSILLPSKSSARCS